VNYIFHQLSYQWLRQHEVPYPQSLPLPGLSPWTTPVTILLRVSDGLHSCILRT